MAKAIQRINEITGVHVVFACDHCGEMNRRGASRFDRSKIHFCNDGCRQEYYGHKEKQDWRKYQAKTDYSFELYWATKRLC